MPFDGSRLPASPMTRSWYEIWADEGHDVPYLLMLRPTAASEHAAEPTCARRRELLRLMASEGSEMAGAVLSRRRSISAR